MPSRICSLAFGLLSPVGPWFFLVPWTVLPVSIEPKRGSRDTMGLAFGHKQAFRPLMALVLDCVGPFSPDVFAPIGLVAL